MRQSTSGTLDADAETVGPVIITGAERLQIAGNLSSTITVTLQIRGGDGNWADVEAYTEDFAKMTEPGRGEYRLLASGTSGGSCFATMRIVR